jgi:thiamine pyrophosphokinase
MPAEERVLEPDVVVVAAGPGPAVSVPAATTVVAADGGLDRAASLGLVVDVLVGDLDSVSRAALERAQADGVRVVRHPEAKDASDLELSLDEAVALGARRVLVVASDGGRLDHLLTSVLLLASERYSALELDAVVGDTLVHVVRDERTLWGATGDVVTLVALGGSASGVTTEGLAYPLSHETLHAGSTRGVSNVFLGDEASVRVAHGTLLAIRPGAATTGRLW